MWLIELFMDRVNTRVIPAQKKKKPATSLIRAQETQFWLLVAQGYRLQILARVQQECDRLARLSAYLISTENEEI